MGGAQDIPLNDTGRQQAAELASELKQLPIQLIVTSPLSRALETAQIASADMHISIIPSPDLIEVDRGDAGGMPRKEAEAKFSQVYKDWFEKSVEDSFDIRLPGGETKGAFVNRINTCLLDVCHTQPEEHIAISTHSGVIWNFFKFLVKTDNIDVNHCQISKAIYLHDTGEFIATD